MRETPTMYPAYAESTPDPRFTDWLRTQAEPTFSRAVDHPFTQELAAGTLEKDAYATYLIQDYAFIDALVGTFGHAVGQAPDMPTKRRLVGFLDTLTDEENDYFERSFAALHVSPARWMEPDCADTTLALIDLLGRASDEGGYEETLAVLVAAEWVYEEWASSVDPNDDLPFYYAEWIDLHANPGFVAFVAWLRSQLDTYGPVLSESRQSTVAQLFRRTIDLEVDFFDMAYPSRDAVPEELYV